MSGFAGNGPEYTHSDSYTDIKTWAQSRIGLFTGVAAPRDDMIIAPLSWMSHKYKAPEKGVLMDAVQGDYPRGNFIVPVYEKRRDPYAIVHVDVPTYAIVIAKIATLYLKDVAKSMRHIRERHDPYDFSWSDCPETSALIEFALTNCGLRDDSKITSNKVMAKSNISEAMAE